MAVKVEELYSNLNKLLEDICKFLTDEGTLEKLSPYARQQADELISRSKKQLQDISKITDNECDGAYVDMDRNVGNNEDKNNIYSSVDEPPLQPVVVQPQLNPYANLPARDLSPDVKYGNLSWKCKIILRFEKVRRIYAGVHHNWLLIYSCEKDSKPLHTFDLRFHKAEAVISKQSKSLPQDFELACTLGERKTYYFLALTHKDMLQWISHINRCNDSMNKFETLSISEGSISETYDKIPELDRKENEEKKEEEIYHDIEPYYPDVQITARKPPDLPARRCIKTNIPLPPIPQNNDDSSDSSTYDPVVPPRGSVGSNSSFSSDDEEDVYEQFVAKPQIKINKIKTINFLQNSKEDNNETYINNAPGSTKNTLEKPKTPAKPTFLREKPKVLKK